MDVRSSRLLTLRTICESRRFVIQQAMLLASRKRRNVEFPSHRSGVYNRRLERTRHEWASLLSYLGEPLKRIVIWLLVEEYSIKIFQIHWYPCDWFVVVRSKSRIALEFFRDQAQGKN